MTIISHSDNEPQYVILGSDEDRPGRVTIPPRNEIELRGRFGTHVSLDLRVEPDDPAHYLGLSPRLTLVRALLYPPSEPEDTSMHSFAWGGGSPFREDLEQRRLSPMGSVDLSTRSMLTGSSVGVVVRNNTDESIEAEVRVAYTSLGGWCEVTDQNELEGVMDKTNALIDALRWRKNTSSGDGAPS